MALTKIQIVESVQNQTGFPNYKSSEIVETLLEIIKSTLASGDDVLVRLNIILVSDPNRQ